jgi:hypothetical protein
MNRLVLALVFVIPTTSVAVAQIGPAVEWDPSGHFKPVKLAEFPNYALECESDPQHHVGLHIKPGEKTVTLIPDVGKGEIKSFPITANTITVTKTYNRFGNKQLFWRIAVLKFNGDDLRRVLSNGNSTYQPYVSLYVESNDRGWRRYNCVPMATE